MAEVILTGSELLCTYTEPTVNSNGTPLIDLVKTRIYYQLQGQEPVMVFETPATSPNGGGVISQRIVVPVAEGEEAFADIWFTAVDDVENESAKSPVITKQIDRLAPAPPQ